MPHPAIVVSVAPATRIAAVLIDRAEKRNALTLPMWRALAEAMDALSADASVRCVLLRGAGEAAFSAGADVAAFREERGTPEREAAYAEALEAAFLSVERCAHPVVAAVRGWAMGGGCGLALMSDIRIGGPGTRMGIPARMLNLYYPHAGLDALLRVAGHAVAAEVMLEGRTYTGAEAEARRLLTRMVPDDSGVFAEAEATAARVAEGAPLANRYHKRALRRLRGPLPLDEAARAEEAAFPATEDFAEAVAAFLARRPPVFAGR